MEFVLYLLVNAALFLRPAEIVDEWKTIPVYEILIIACLSVSGFAIIRQLWAKAFWQQPITLFMFAMLLCILLSGLDRFDAARSAKGGEDFLKIIVYYMLFVCVVSTSGRLKVFLVWTTILATFMIALAVLDFHGAIDVPGLKHIADQEEVDAVSQRVFMRLSGTGIFNDPNDVCMLFVVTIPLCVWLVVESRHQLLRFVWLAPLVLFGYGLYLTKSRGGLLAVVMGIVALLWSRFGPRVAWILMLILLPGMLFFFAGRQTDLSSSQTMWERFELWQDAVSAVKDSPAFGIGYDQFQKDNYYVVHNSFLHCYAELGLIGGTVFFGMFLFALWSLYRLNTGKAQIIDPTLRGLNPYLLAIIVGTIGLLMSLSRSYIVPTYMVLGIVTVHVQMAATQPYLPPLQLNRRFFFRLGVASAVFLAVSYISLRVLVRY